MKRLSLRDFRNYHDVELALEPGVTVFTGSNGHGKTNLVEAIAYLGTARSHRTSDERALVRTSCGSAVIRGLLHYDNRELLIEVELNRDSPNRAQLARAPIKMRDLPRSFSCVLFAPEDLGLVRGDPAGRRGFIDGLLVQRTPRLAGTLADYERVVRQRNTLLKSARQQRIRADQLGTLDIWDERLIQLGSEIISEREKLVNDLGDPLARAYYAVAGENHHPHLHQRLSIVAGESIGDDASAEEHGLVSKTGVAREDLQDDSSTMSEIPEIFQHALAQIRSRELERGLTLVGPHRDDIVFTLNALPAKGYASHGESWSYALALRLASAELLRHESTIGDPVLILDDVFAELDARRRRTLASSVGDYEQVLITAAVLEDIPDSLDARVIQVRAGRVLTGHDIAAWHHGEPDGDVSGFNDSAPINDMGHVAHEGMLP